MNMELRKDILYKSLSIEDLLSSLLAILFRFPKDSSKTLGHSSSALSFKQKADLLKDLGRLNATDYNDLILFMEIRNQLIHNLKTDTLLKAAQRCDKLNKLLAHSKDLQTEFSNYDDLKLKEGVLKMGLQNLYDRILDFIQKVINIIVQEIELEESRKTAAVQSELLIEITEFLGNAVDTVSKIRDDYYSSIVPEFQ